MPVPRRDKNSGAIIFDLTPDEIKVNTLEKEIEELRETVNKLITKNIDASKGDEQLYEL